MKPKKINQVRAGALVSYITIFFNIISGFLYTPWLINRLGQSDYGLYQLIISVMTYFVLDLGMGAAITRFISRYRVNNEDEKIYNLLGVTTKLYLAIDGIIFVAMVVFYFLIDKIYTRFTPDEIIRFENVFIIAGVVALVSFPLLPINGIFTAYEKLYAQKVFDLAAKVLTITAVVIALLAGGGLYFVVLFNTGITFVINLIKFLYIRKTEKLRFNFKYRDKALTKSIFGFSAWVMVASIADRFFFMFIPSILGIVSGLTEITLFSVAVSVENYTCLFSGVFNNLFLPQVTTMVVKNESREKITDLMIKVGRIQLIIVSAVVTAIISMGKEFITCWVGADLVDAYVPLVIIMIPTLVHFCQAIGTEMIYATNNVKYRALVYICGSVISTALTFALGGKYGALGAGIGIGAGLLLSHVILINIIYWKKLGLNIPRYFKECQLKMLLPMVISGAIGFFISSIYPVDSLILFIFKGAIWGVCHMAIVWFMFLNKYEKDLFMGYVKSTFSIVGRILKRNKSN